MTVHFQDVGRNKKNWDAQMDTLSDRALIREIKDQKALMSSGITFEWSPTGTSAKVVVGLGVVVGEIHVSGGVKVQIQ